MNTDQKRNANPDDVSSVTDTFGGTTYQLYLSSFADGRGTGRGNHEGLIRRIQYLKYLGIERIMWGPDEDFPEDDEDGPYSIRTYCKVSPLFGDDDTKRRLVAKLHQAKIRVISDLVLGHVSTSSQWFQEARRDPTGPAGQRFIRIPDDERARYRNVDPIFTDHGRYPWSSDREYGTYYRVFKPQQAAINLANADAWADVLEVVDYHFGDWEADDGRLDALTYWAPPDDGGTGEYGQVMQNRVSQLGLHLKANHPGKGTIGELAGTRETVARYFPDLDESYDFQGAALFFAALVLEDWSSIREMYLSVPEWASRFGNFVRNHDELQLKEPYLDGGLADIVRREYGGPGGRYTVHHGIKPRLAFMLKGNRKAIEMAHAYLHLIEGHPWIFSGDELGAEGDPMSEDRFASRPPFAHDHQLPKAGFSTASRLWTDMGPDWWYNAASLQKGDPASNLERTRRWIRLRREFEALRAGGMDLRASGAAPVLAAARTYPPADDVLFLINNSWRPRRFEADFGPWGGQYLRMLDTNPRAYRRNLNRLVWKSGGWLHASGRISDSLGPYEVRVYVPEGR